MLAATCRRAVSRSLFVQRQRFAVVLASRRCLSGGDGGGGGGGGDRLHSTEYVGVLFVYFVDNQNELSALLKLTAT